MKMKEKALLARDAKRNIGAELLESVREMNRGEGRVVYSPVIEARTKAALSQAQFAKLLGVSVRTLQSWEQGRRQPAGPARALIKVLQAKPKAVIEALQAA
jgi:putative transcriptional regulator